MPHSVMNIQRQEVPILARQRLLELQAQDLENIDAGFMEGKKFDFKDRQKVFVKLPP